MMRSNYSFAVFAADDCNINIIFLYKIQKCKIGNALHINIPYRFESCIIFLTLTRRPCTI